MYSPEIVRKFWSFIDKSEHPKGCWVWTAGKTGHGYGQFCGIPKTIVYAHRFSFSLHVGREIPRTIEVLHSCDNPSCVRPDHLSEGTHKQNMLDAAAKGHMGGPRGELSGAAKMTWEAVRKIRQEYASQKTTFRELGKKYGISNRNVCSIVRCETWKEENNEN